MSTPVRALHEHLRRAYAAAIKLGFDEHRKALLVGIDHRIVSGLPSFGANGAQIYGDLFELARIGRLADGSFPLDQWLAAAELLGAGRQEAIVFTYAREILATGWKRALTSSSQSPIWGRAREVESLVSWASGPLPCAVLVSGALGTGKTALAQEVLHHPELVRRFGDQRFFLALDPVFEPFVFWDVLGQALGLVGASPQFILDELRRKPSLLVLDALDRLMGTLDRELAEILRALSQLDDLGIFAVCRGPSRPDGIRWQHSLTVGPLSETASLDLFDELAPEHAPDDRRRALISTCDGLPLAISLLARAARGMPLDLLLAEQRAAPDARREGLQESWLRTLQTVWNAGGLTEGARSVARALATLPDGARLSELEVLFPGSPAGIRRLLQAGIATMTHGRVRMMTPVRRAIYVLRPDGAMEERRFLDHYRHKAEVAQHVLRSGADDGSAKWLQEESANLSALVAIGLSSHDALAWVNLALSLAETRHWYAGHPLPITEARRVAQTVGDAALEVRCLLQLGEDALRAGRLEGAICTFQECLGVYRRAGDPTGMAMCLQRLAETYSVLHEQREAERHAQEAARAFEALGDEAGAAASYALLAKLSREHGEHDAAESYLGRAQRAFALIGDLVGQALCLRQLGDTVRRRGDSARACGYFEQARGIYSNRGIVLGVAISTRALAEALVDIGRLNQAAEMFACAEDIYKQMNDARGQAHCALGMGDIALQRDLPCEARPHYELASALYGQSKDAAGLFWCESRLAEVVLLSGQPLAAIERYRAVLESGGGTRFSIASAHKGLADAYQASGNSCASRIEYELARGIYRQLGDEVGAAECERGLGGIAFTDGRLLDAEAHYRNALFVFETAGNPRGHADTLVGLADVASARTAGTGAASAYLQQALDIFESLGNDNLAREVSRKLSRLDPA